MAKETPDTQTDEKETPEETQMEEVKTDDVIDNFLNEDVDNMPDADENFIERVNEKNKDASNNKNGQEFNPEIHTTDKNGDPVLNLDGSFRKKRGRKASTVGTVGSKAKSDAPVNTISEEARVMGTVAAGMTFQIGMAIGGADFAPMKDEKNGVDEVAQMTFAYANYFNATGKKDIPPGIALALALGSYALPRLASSKTTRNRLKLFGGWVKLKWSNMRNNKKPKEKTKKDT